MCWLQQTRTGRTLKCGWCANVSVSPLPMSVRAATRRHGHQSARYVCGHRPLQPPGGGLAAGSLRGGRSGAGSALGDVGCGVCAQSRAFRSSSSADRSLSRYGLDQSSGTAGVRGSRLECLTKPFSLSLAVPNKTILPLPCRERVGVRVEPSSSVLLGVLKGALPPTGGLRS